MTAQVERVLIAHAALNSKVSEVADKLVSYQSISDGKHRRVEQLMSQLLSVASDPVPGVPELQETLHKLSMALPSMRCPGIDPTPQLLDLRELISSSLGTVAENQVELFRRLETPPVAVTDPLPETPWYTKLNLWLIGASAPVGFIIGYLIRSIS